MKKSLVIALSILVTSLTVVNQASAFPGESNGRGPQGHPPVMQEHPGQGGPEHHDMPMKHDGMATGRPDNWHRGERLEPDYYQNRGYWVEDWRSHRLPAPPEGHRWLDIDGRYVLAAIATGVITNIILNQ